MGVSRFAFLSSSYLFMSYLHVAIHHRLALPWACVGTLPIARLFKQNIDIATLAAGGLKCSETAALNDDLLVCTT